MLGMQFFGRKEKVTSYGEVKENVFAQKTLTVRKENGAWKTWENDGAQKEKQICEMGILHAYGLKTL